MKANKDELGFECLKDIRVLVFGCWFSISRTPLIPVHPTGEYTPTHPYILRYSESPHSFVVVTKDWCRHGPSFWESKPVCGLLS
jgi:hypothetical protein